MTCSRSSSCSRRSGLLYIHISSSYSYFNFRIWPVVTVVDVVLVVDCFIFIFQSQNGSCSRSSCCSRCSGLLYIHISSLYSYFNLRMGPVVAVVAVVFVVDCFIFIFQYIHYINCVKLKKKDALNFYRMIQFFQSYNSSITYNFM